MNLSRLLLSLALVGGALAGPDRALAASAPRQLLVVSVTTGFRHSSIPTGEKILQELAVRDGRFHVDFVRQPEGLPPPPARPRPGKEGPDAPAHREALAKFAEEEKAYWRSVDPQIRAALQPLSPANLKKYDAVLFLSTTGDLPLPDPQGFVDWIASGKGFIGVHAAADTFHRTGRFAGFPPYTAMLGGAFRHHGPQVSVECVREDGSHPACAALPARWTVFDEIYEFKEYDRARVHGLISMEKHPQTKEPGHHGVAWARTHGAGRVFYTSLGHREDVWDATHPGDAKGGRKNPPEVARQYQQHLLGGIRWALGLEPAKITSAR